jgi:exodeoxyribonuclease VII small subunit
MSNTGSSFEEAMKKLEKIVEELDKGEFSLEESLKKFEEGMKLGQTCKSILEKAEFRVRKLVDAHGRDQGEMKETDVADDF